MKHIFCRKSSESPLFKDTLLGHLDVLVCAVWVHVHHRAIQLNTSSVLFVVSPLIDVRGKCLEDKKQWVAVETLMITIVTRGFWIQDLATRSLIFSLLKLGQWNMVILGPKITSLGTSGSSPPPDPRGRSGKSFKLPCWCAKSSERR